MYLHCPHGNAQGMALAGRAYSEGEEEPSRMISQSNTAGMHSCHAYSRSDIADL
jgi:hypothetical protein